MVEETRAVLYANGTTTTMHMPSRVMNDRSATPKTSTPRRRASPLRQPLYSLTKAPRRSITPISHLPPDGQARIHRAQQHLEYDDVRTGYTYAATKTYQTRGADGEYESPLLARIPLRHYESFTPNKSFSGVRVSEIVVDRLSHFMHQIWYILTAPIRFGAHVLSTNQRRANTLCCCLLPLLLLLLLLLVGAQYREQTESVFVQSRQIYSRLYDFYAHTYTYTGDSLYAWRESAYSACASLGAAATRMFEFDLAPTGGSERVGAVVGWLWAQPAALWAAMSRSHIEDSHFDEQQPSTSRGGCLPPCPHRDTELIDDVHALRERVDSLSANLAALTAASASMAQRVAAAASVASDKSHDSKYAHVDHTHDGLYAGRNDVHQTFVGYDARLLELLEQVAAMRVSIEQVRAQQRDQHEQYTAIVGQINVLRELSTREEAVPLPNVVSITSNTHDLDEVERLIVAALRRYDADKTGRVDYALESAGGQIVSTRCTRTYSPRTRRESVYGIPLWYSNVSPRSVIQRKSQSIIPGECWSFEGAVGHLLVGLAGTIRMTAVTYEHIPLTMSPDGHLDSAPKLFQLWGYQTENDPNATQIAEFTYSIDVAVDSMQTFKMDTSKFVRSKTVFANNQIQPAASKPWPMVEVRVMSNHGHPTYTCMYRFRVHGQRVYPGYGQEQQP